MPTFSTLFTKPATPTGLVLTPDSGLSKISLEWDDSVETFFDEYRVYRQDYPGMPWVRVDDGSLTAAASSEWVDYMAPVMVTTAYRVTQYSGAVESDPVEGSTRIANGSFWVGIPGDEDHLLEIPMGESRSIEPTTDDEVLQPLGRWGAVLVGEPSGGPKIAFTFSLDATTRHFFFLLEEIRDLVLDGSADFAFLKDPHGGTWKVALESLSSRMQKGGFDQVSLMAYAIEQ